MAAQLAERSARVGTLESQLSAQRQAAALAGAKADLLQLAVAKLQSQSQGGAGASPRAGSTAGAAASDSQVGNAACLWLFTASSFFCIGWWYDCLGTCDVML